VHFPMTSASLRLSFSSASLRELRWFRRLRFLGLISVLKSGGMLSTTALVHAENTEGRESAEKGNSSYPSRPSCSSREINGMLPCDRWLGFGSHEGTKAGRKGGLLYFPGFRLSPRRHCERSAAIQSFPDGALDCRVAALLAMTEIA
jgi:hypothetical protein